MNATNIYQATQLYPTPTDVIEVMVQQFTGYNAHANWLEPSAGRGDIADYLMAHDLCDRSNLTLVEQSENLCHLLRGKGYHVHGTSFESFAPEKKFDCIIMNPPFARGISHVKQAFELLAEGGRLVALLNNAAFSTETNDPRDARFSYSNRRQQEWLRNTVDLYGAADVLGQVFTQSDHYTDVEVVMVTLDKPKARQSFTFDFDRDYDEESEPDEHDDPLNGVLVSTDEIAALVARYNAARAALKKRNDADHMFIQCVTGIRGIHQPQTTNLLEDYALLRKMFWEHVFKLTSINKIVTTGFAFKWQRRMNSLKQYGFTERNIRIAVQSFIINYKDNMIDCLLELFNTATEYHTENRVNGWKHNQSWQCAIKIVLPHTITWDVMGTNLKLQYPYDPNNDDTPDARVRGSNRTFIQDIDKVIVWLDHKRLDDVTTVEETIEAHLDALRAGTETNHSKVLHSTYFEIRIYKNGNTHLRWKHQHLWEKFNRTAAQGKGWVGSGSRGVARNFADDEPVQQPLWSM